MEFSIALQHIIYVCI